MNADEKKVITLLAICLPLLLLMAGASAATSGGCYSDGSGALHRWTLNNTVGLIDQCAIVAAKDLTNAGAASGAAGAFAEAYDFEAGDTDSMTNTYLVPVTFSVSMWWKPESHAAISWIIDGRATTYVAGTIVEWNTGKIAGVCNGAHVGVVSPASYNDGEFIHIVYTVNDATKNNTLYINSTGVATAIEGSSCTTEATGMLIGKRQAGTFPADGVMDEIQVFNYTLNQTEITNLYTYNNISGVTPAATTITFTRSSQTPADLNTLNAVATGLWANYTITGQNATTPRFYGMTNSSTDANEWYINGTAYSSWHEDAFLSGTYNWYMDDNDIYPATYNTNETTLENTAHSFQSLSSANQWAKVELYNVSSTTQYGFFEWMANRTTGLLPFWYCNSTYSTGDPTVSSSCTQFGSAPDGTVFNHSHTAQSKHMVVPFTPSGGMINTVAVTGTSYFLVRGSPSNTVYPYYVATTSRTLAARSSTNGGTAWSTLAGTYDAHLHQFGLNTTLYYFASACNATACYNDTVYSDDMGLAPLPPSAPNVLTPTNNTHYNSAISITWTNSTSPQNSTITGYNIIIYYENLTQYAIPALAIPGNNYTWDITGVPDGWYRAGVQAVDDGNRTDIGLSGYFYTDTAIPVISIYAPVTNDTYYTGTSAHMNVLGTDSYMYNLSCDVLDSTGATVASYKNDTGSGATFTLKSEFTSALAAGNYNLSCSGQDSHTALTDDGSAATTGTSKIDLIKNSDVKATITNTEAKMTKVVITKLVDQNKITYIFSTPLTNFNETVTSKYPITIMAARTNISCHLVFGSRWYDAADAVKQGWTCKATQLTANSVRLDYASKGLSSIDPATGGLNTGYASATFTMLTTLNLTGAIEMNMVSSDAPTYTYCDGANVRTQLNRTVCLGGICTDTQVYSTIICPNGCYNGACQQPPENYTIYAIIAVIVLILILVALGLT